MCQVVTHSRRAMAQVEKNGLRGARKLRSSEWLCRVLELGETGTQQYIGYRIYIYIYILLMTFAVVLVGVVGGV